MPLDQRPVTRDRFVARFDSRRNRYQARVTGWVVARFEAEGVAVVAAYVDHGEAAMIREIQHQRIEWAALLQRIYARVGGSFAEMVLAELPAKADPLNIANAAILERIAAEGAARIVGISEVTRVAVQQALLDGLLANEGIDKLALRIQKVYAGFTRVRAETIARTEVIAASNLGSLEAASASGLRLDKQWVTTRDGRTREAHRAVMGQTKPIDEAFIVDGERLMYPGDSSLGASAGNTINCRCTMVYRRAKG